MNLCRSCGQDFGSLEAFDAHRVGPHDGDRRCLTLDEMTADGRFERNRYGRWTLVARVKRAASVFALTKKMAPEHLQR